MAAAVQQYLSPYRVFDTNIYAIPMDVYKSLDVKQWKYNRPPDMNRVPEIHAWMEQFNRMDGLLNLAYIPGEGLVCFEGNHRRLALEGVNIRVLVDILWNATDEIVIHEFRRLNKSVSVPELYVEPNSATLRLEIQDAAEELCKKYPTHCKPTNRPIRPNFNRDKLIDELTRLQREHQLPVRELISQLLKQSESRDKKGLPEKIKQTCEKTGLWLFAWSSSLHLEPCV